MTRLVLSLTVLPKTPYPSSHYVLVPKVHRPSTPVEGPVSSESGLYWPQYSPPFSYSGSVSSGEGAPHSSGCLRALVVLRVDSVVRYGSGPTLLPPGPDLKIHLKTSGTGFLLYLLCVRSFFRLYGME